MFASQIEYCMEGDRLFQGVFSIDTIPHLCSGTLIINTAPAEASGAHWLAVVVGTTNRESGYYFDSYGRPPPQVIVDFLNRNCEAWNYNVHQLQSIDTQCCGQWCVDFCKYVSSQNDPIRYPGNWYASTAHNDAIVSMRVGKGCGELCFGQSCQSMLMVDFKASTSARYK